VLDRISTDYDSAWDIRRWRSPCPLALPASNSDNTKGENKFLRKAIFRFLGKAVSKYIGENATYPRFSGASPARSRTQEENSQRAMSKAWVAGPASSFAKTPRSFMEANQTTKASNCDRAPKNPFKCLADFLRSEIHVTLQPRSRRTTFLFRVGFAKFAKQEQANPLTFSN